MTSETPLQTAKARLDLLTVAHDHGLKLRRAGAGWQCICPMPDHAGERTPSFLLNMAGKHRGRYKCYGCGAYGDALDLFAALRGISKSEAIQIINADAGMMPQVRPQVMPQVVPQVKRETPEEVRARAVVLQTFLSACSMPLEVARYAATRGLTKMRYGAKLAGIDETNRPGVLAEMRTTYTPEQLEKAGLWRGGRCIFGRGSWLLIPYFWQGLPIHIQGRAAAPQDGPKYLHLAGVTTPLYNFDALAGAPEGSRIIVCEGAINAISWGVDGKTAVATGSATRFPDALFRHAKGKRFVCDFDKDRAGDKGVEKLEDMLRKAGGVVVGRTCNDADANECIMSDLPILDRLVIENPAILRAVEIFKLQPETNY